MGKYVIIGGQYALYNYGTADTLRGAKCKATRNAEHWDNWQGWHKPAVYNAADVDGDADAVGFNHARPRLSAVPVAVWDGKKWTGGGCWYD